ncbi:unnamed protein product [Urochloa decumbens]|uniref:Protein kinase domain-containing protein n=1 Tax=Urochloa decumbens TaxID=240449 RepID=A0ABC9H9Q5_9POAL
MYSVYGRFGEVRRYLIQCKMALWNGLGQAATVAQLGGVDAGGLISMIVQAVQTVHRNKEECRQLVHHVMMISDLLQLLQQSEMMQSQEIRRPLDGLVDTLRQAYMLVTSCQQSNIMYRFLMAGNQAQKFRDIRDRIDSYLRIFPLISHIDTRYFISGFFSGAHPSAPQRQASEKMLESFASHGNPDSRTQGNTSNDNDIIESVEVQGVTKQFAVEEHQQHGYGNAKVLPIRKHRFRWFVQWARREPSRCQSVCEVIGPDQQSGSICKERNDVLSNGFLFHRLGFTIFKFSQLAASTNNFSSHNLIGKGGFGQVYKGVLPNGVDVAIKKSHVFDKSRCISEFENELQIIPKLQHANIIKLLGCCIEDDVRILVYEYMPRGSLHNITQELKAGVFLAWHLRFRIIEGIAQGAVYLHHHSRLRLVHGDLKPGNILLDCDMTPRITDFGMAEVLSSDEDKKETDVVAGTMGYLDPDYYGTRFISIKSDVYAFGVTILEIITGQKAIISGTIRKSLPDYAWEFWSSGRARELIDASLHDEPRINEILRCMHIALLCVELEQADRPTMSDVLMMLKCESMALPVPRSAAYRLKEEVGESSADKTASSRSSRSEQLKARI